MLFNSLRRGKGWNPPEAPGKNPHPGLLRALFHDTAFDDYFAECAPFSIPLFTANRLSFSPSDSSNEHIMLNWVITFFLLAVIAAVCGFGGLAGTFAQIAKLIAVVFVVLFIASLIYSAISGRRPNPPAL
jgi:uncharacterized membrane protein YtjA (UPF0391 family)